MLGGPFTGYADAMPDRLPPSEFGFSSKKNTLAPEPHEPTASEKLRLLYMTGSEDGETPDPESFRGGGWPDG